MLVLFIAEADKAVSTRLASLLVGHDLGRLAGRESSLEEGDENEFINLVAKVTNKDRELGASVIATINKTTSRGPVKAKDAVSVRDGRSVELERLLSGVGRGELDEAVTRVAMET